MTSPTFHNELGSVFARLVVITCGNVYYINVLRWVISHFKVHHRFRAQGYLDQVTEKTAWWHFHALGKGITSRKIGWSPHFRLNPCSLPELIPEAWLGPGLQSGNLPRSPARKARKLVPPAYRHLRFPASFLGKLWQVRHLPWRAILV